MNLFDLIAAFFRWIGRVCKKSFALFLDSLHLSLHYWFVSVPVIILFAGLAFYYSRPLNRIYKAEGIVYLNGPLIEDVKQVFKPVEQNYHFFPGQDLQKILNLTEDETDGLRRFEIFNVIDYNNDSTVDMVDYKRNHKLDDTINVVMPHVLCIRFLTKRPDNVPVVGEHMIAYLNNSAALKAAYEKKKVLLERKATFWHDQLEKLDSLTSAFYFEQGASAQAQMKWGNGMVLGRREIALFLPEIMDAYKKAEDVDHELAKATAPVVIQQQFTTLPRAINGRLKCLVLAVIIGYIIGALIALIISKRKDIQKWYRG